MALSNLFGRMGAGLRAAKIAKYFREPSDENRRRKFQRPSEEA